ncbi:MAG: DUF2244 domain-containing protein [Burkholderiaceae bacterium]
MHYQWTYVAEPHQHQWVLKRNCAMSPARLASSVGLVGLVSLAIAAVCAYFGAWPVLPFAGIEVAALAVAFFVYGRHAGDYERIVVSSGSILVESVIADRVVRRRLQPGRVRVEYREGSLAGERQLIRLVSDGQELAVGRFVPDHRRALLARELRTSLGGRLGL